MVDGIEAPAQVEAGQHCCVFSSILCWYGRSVYEASRRLTCVDSQVGTLVLVLVVKLPDGLFLLNLARSVHDAAALRGIRRRRPGGHDGGVVPALVGGDGRRLDRRMRNRGILGRGQDEALDAGLLVRGLERIQGAGDCPRDDLLGIGAEAEVGDDVGNSRDT